VKRAPRSEEVGGEKPEPIVSPLEISLLGPFRVRRRGHLVTDRAWRTYKAKELFAYLLARDGCSATRDELLEALWPGTYVGRYDYWSPYETLAANSSAYSSAYSSEYSAALSAALSGAAPPDCSATPSEAWTLLAGGDSAGAYQAFACLADAVPDDGFRLFGLALSAGMQERHDEAVAAARKAVRTDPESLRYVQVQGDRQLEAVFASLLAHYEHRAVSVYGDLDAIFMVAVLRFFRGELAAARYAVDVGTTLGDDEAIMRFLRHLIAEAQEQEQEQKPQEPPEPSRQPG
jgi:hypothetical protein